MFFKSIFIFSALCFNSYLASKELKCPLVWKETTNGNKQLSDLVHVHNGAKQFAARISYNDTTNTRYVVGTYDPEIDLAAFPVQDFENNKSVLIASTFELLTNPYECILKWPEHKNGQIPSSFSVGTGSPNMVIGRVIFDKNPETAIWLTGEIDITKKGIFAPYLDNIEFSSSYQVLVSYSKGLRLDVSEVVSNEDLLENKLDFMGIDVYHNQGNAEISQILKHFKHIIEISTFSTTKETTSSKTQSVGFDALIVAASVKVEHTYKETVTEEFTTIKETEIRTEKVITIPPHTSVTACSSVSLKEDIVLPFTAKGVYKVPGWSPEEVAELLDEEGIKSTIVAGEVITNIIGTFKGNVALSNKFNSVPADDPAGCNLIQKKEFEQKLRDFENFRKLLNKN